MFAWQQKMQSFLHLTGVGTSAVLDKGRASQPLNQAQPLPGENRRNTLPVLRLECGMDSTGAESPVDSGRPFMAVHIPRTAA